MLIFVAFRDSGNPNGLITLGVSGVQVSVGGEDVVCAESTGMDCGYCFLFL